mgnify:CR=1 FL=1
MPIDHPLVSIVTPSYNQAHFLEETIQSVLEQDYPNIEYIIIDGGSTDGSVNLIRKYEHRLAYWVSEPDKGQSQAINKGFARSHGQILAWLNSDDLYLPGALRHAVWTLQRSEASGVVSGACGVISADGHRIGVYRAPTRPPSVRSLLLNGNCIAQPSTFFRRSDFERVGGLDENLHYPMDLHLWLRLLSFTTLTPVPRMLAAFRLHPLSKTMAQENATAWLRDELYVVNDYLGGIGAALLPKEVRREALVQTLLHCLERLDPESAMAHDVLTQVRDLSPPLAVREVERSLAKIDARDLLQRAPQVEQPSHALPGDLGPVSIEAIALAKHQTVSLLATQGLLSNESTEVAIRAIRSMRVLLRLAATHRNLDGALLRRWLIWTARQQPRRMASRTWVSLFLQSWGPSRIMVQTYKSTRRSRLDPSSSKNLGMVD